MIQPHSPFDIVSFDGAVPVIDFSCGHAGLDGWLKYQASLDEAKNITRTFVALDQGTVAGFYSLRTASIEFESMHKRQRVTAALIPRLAVANDYKGRGLAGQLLHNALRRIVDASTHDTSIGAVLVEAFDQQARAFSLHYGFGMLPGVENKLFLPIETVLKAVKMNRTEELDRPF